MGAYLPYPEDFSKIMHIDIIILITFCHKFSFAVKFNCIKIMILELCGCYGVPGYRGFRKIVQFEGDGGGG